MSPIDQPIQPWTKDKLDLLGKYLHAYSTIMSNQGWLKSYSYVDAFANTGKYVDEDTQSYVDGSPLIALKCNPSFSDYWFVDLAQTRVERLKRIVDVDFPRQHVNFRNGDANLVLRDEVCQTIRKAAKTRALVFLDPYGLEVDFATVRALGENGAFDIFLNFSTMGIVRNLERGQLPDPAVLKIIDRVMGDTHWAEDQYSSRMDLFGETHHTRPPIQWQDCADAYLAKVKEVFAHVSEPVVMYNSKGAPIYVLFLASHNSTGVKITNQVFQKYDRLRTQQSRLFFG